MSKSEQDPKPFSYAANFKSPVTQVLEADLEKGDLQAYVNGILGLKRPKPDST